MAPSRLDLCEQMGQDGLGTSWRCPPVSITNPTPPFSQMNRALVHSSMSSTATPYAGITEQKWAEVQGFRATFL